MYGEEVKKRMNIQNLKELQVYTENAKNKVEREQNR